MNEKNVVTLKRLLKSNKHQRKHIIKNAERDFIQFLCECGLNVINGNVPVNKNLVFPYEDQLRALCQPKQSDYKRRKVLLTNKCINLVGVIGPHCCLYLE